MSVSYKKQELPIRGVDFSQMSEEDIDALYKKVLNQGVHGLCFSAYEEGQHPDEHELSEEQIRRRLNIMAPYTKWTRTFSCIEGNELIPPIAKEVGIKTMVGAWIGDDLEKNDAEIEGLIRLAKDGYVDIAAVGNEVLLRNDVSEDQLLDYIHRVKEAVPNIPVAYVDAYYEFTLHPRITDASDVILINCYPFWEGCHIDYSLPYMQQMYNQALQAGNGNKKVIISETGWPSAGTNFKASEPSDINFKKYFINTQLWAKRDDIDVLYFTSFDEGWKVGAEGDVGAYWGIWDKNENFKY